MNILDKIVAVKQIEVERAQKEFPLEAICQTSTYERKTYSLAERLNTESSSGIIAEFKRKSPSKGIINAFAEPAVVAADYQQYGAAAVSILTDQEFFGGSSQDLKDGREVLSIPVLRKDFIIDSYQIHESKAMGADLILLIAACLSPVQVQEFASLAKTIGLEVLLELHDEEELNHVCNEIDFVGINNRSLKTFDVDIERSLRMAASLPKQKIKIAESGIDDPSQILRFKSNGYKGFLIGENFMKTENPGETFRDFVKETGLP
jgi:indole-3-glycerol phosphate synthase